MRRIREQGHRVADFNTLDDLVEHARKEGATHVYKGHKTWGDPNEAYLYFPRGDGSYEEAGVYKERGYLHLTAQTSSRGTVPQLPSVARPIKDPRWGRRTAEAGQRGVTEAHRKPESGPTSLIIDGGLEARLLKSSFSKTMGATTETWVVHQPGEPGQSVLQVDIFKPRGQPWAAWTGNFTRAHQRKIADDVATARNGTGTASAMRENRPRSAHHRSSR